MLQGEEWCALACAQKAAPACHCVAGVNTAVVAVFLSNHFADVRARRGTLSKNNTVSARNT
jgi:hypothetical protein